MHNLIKSVFSTPALYVYGAMKLVLIAFFSLSLNYAGTVSAQEEIACTGKDLMVELTKSEPGVLAGLREQAAETIYGNARLWRLSKPGIADSWLFGTIHMAEKSVSTLPQSARIAFENSDKVLVEITDMMDPEIAQATIIKLKHLVFRLDGTTIESDISAQQIEQLKAAAAARSIPYQLAIRMQPLMLAPAISNQLCEVVAKKTGKLFLDAKLMKLAIENGKQLVALETTKEQLSAIASMPQQFQLSMLVETLKLGDRLNDVKQTMKSLYINGEIAMITPVIRYFSKQYSGLSADNSGSDEFREKLVVDRNIKMAARAEQHLLHGNVFMAVGALHLPGEMGLVALLEKQGFSVQAVSTAIVTQ